MPAQRVRRLRQERLSFTVVLQAVIKAFSRAPNDVLCCFEGRDMGYYGVRIRGELAEFRIAPFNCGGKPSVIALYDSVSRNTALSEARILFFVDRDYDEDISSLDSSRCFVTDGYSIENYYTSAASFERIARSAFFADQLYDEANVASLNRIITMYSQIIEQFHEIIKEFNFWVWVQRRLRPSESGAFNLSIFDRQRLFSVGIKGVAAAYSVEMLNARFPNRMPVSNDEMCADWKWFSCHSASLAFRGKQELQLLMGVLRLLAEQAGRGETPFERKHRVSLRLSDRNAIDDLSTYADTPASLKDFLANARLKWCPNPSKIDG